LAKAPIRPGTGIADDLIAIGFQCWSRRGEESRSILAIKDRVEWTNRSRFVRWKRRGSHFLSSDRPSATRKSRKDVIIRGSATWETTCDHNRNMTKVLVSSTSLQRSFLVLCLILAVISVLTSGPVHLDDKRSAALHDDIPRSASEVDFFARIACKEFDWGMRD
jgi:hypothetical protein